MKALTLLADHFADRASIEVWEIRDLPQFKPVEKRTPSTVPERIQDLSDAIAAADGVIIATPEYNHTIPAPLKSVLEWLSWASESLRGKPVMIVGASYGRLGTSRAQDHLRQILTSPWLRARVLPDEFLLSNSLTAFDEAGALVDQKNIAALEKTFKEFEEFVGIISKIS